MLIKPNRACEIVNLLSPDSVTIDFPFYITLAISFSVGAVNFYSIGRLIVGYLIEQSM